MLLCFSVRSSETESCKKWIDFTGKNGGIQTFADCGTGSALLLLEVRLFQRHQSVGQLTLSFVHFGIGALNENETVSRVIDRRKAPQTSPNFSSLV